MDFYKLVYIDSTPVDNIIASKLSEEETRLKAETELVLHLGEGNFQITEFRKMDDEEVEALERMLEDQLPEGESLDAVLSSAEAQAKSRLN